MKRCVVGRAAVARIWHTVTLTPSHEPHRHHASTAPRHSSATALSAQLSTRVLPLTHAFLAFSDVCAVAVAFLDIIADDRAHSCSRFDAQRLTLSLMMVLWPTLTLTLAPTFPQSQSLTYLIFTLPFALGLPSLSVDGVFTFSLLFPCFPLSCRFSYVPWSRRFCVFLFSVLMDVVLRILRSKKTTAMALDLDGATVGFTTSKFRASSLDHRKEDSSSDVLPTLCSAGKSAEAIAWSVGMSKASSKWRVGLGSVPVSEASRWQV